MKTRYRNFALTVSVFLFAASAWAQSDGAIRGTVVDETGVAVEGARVNASLMDARPMHSVIRYVETDREGYFLIDRLEWGKYGVFAMKEEDAYPDMGSSFYSHNIFPTVTITPSSPSAEVRIPLGPKAGILTGSVTNAVNGAPVLAGFNLIRAASPHEWLDTSAPAHYRILLPSSTDVLVEVSEPGFISWSPGHPLRLQPGAEFRMDIQLEPSHDPNLHPSKFLVPEGYVGWLLLEYNVNDAQPVPISGDIKIFKFPADGALNTSSPGPQRGADDEYFYYSPNGSLSAIPQDYRNGGGMIWGQHEGSRHGQLSQFGFFVGTKAQYEKFKTRMTHPGPLPTP